MENTENIGALPSGSPSGVKDKDALAEGKVSAIEIKKSNRATKERMKELNEIKKKKNEIKKAEKEELKKKLEEIEKLKKERIELEYEQALKEAKQAKSKSKKIIIVPKASEAESDEEEEAPREAPIIKKKASSISAQVEAPTILYKNASRDILKDKYIEEVKKRVMRDLFS